MNTENHRSVVVIGIGNSALSDEGVGCRVAQKVAKKAPPWVEVMDAGLRGPELPDLIKGKKKAVIVDAVDAGGPAGTVYRFRPDQAVPQGTDPHYSLHQGNILLYVKLAEALDMCPDDVVLIGIQPKTLLPGEKLSPDVEKAVDKAANLVLAEADIL